MLHKQWLCLFSASKPFRRPSLQPQRHKHSDTVFLMGPGTSSLSQTQTDSTFHPLPEQEFSRATQLSVVCLLNKLLAYVGCWHSSVTNSVHSKHEVLGWSPALQPFQNSKYLLNNYYTSSIVCRQAAIKSHEGKSKQAPGT